jgi:DNA invertase Pin-like site-specific DNA recombinase
MERIPRRAYSYIRMSTGMQLKGHSRQRQLENSSAYAKAHGLDLVEDLQLEDLGVSAFKGANVAEGALGKFLQAVENGSVPKGSFLIVESLDRLSRQEILKSLTLFTGIVQAGINLVTLQDGHVYREQPELPELLMSLMIMSRAHEESQIKSQRVGAAWANKRAHAAAKPLTKWCPAWLGVIKQFVVRRNLAQSQLPDFALPNF